MIARKLMQELAHPPAPSPAQNPTRDPLTDGKYRCCDWWLRAKATGRSPTNRPIGEGTARAHVSSILSKLHLASRTQATLYALKEGLARLDDADLG